MGMVNLLMAHLQRLTAKQGGQKQPVRLERHATLEDEALQRQWSGGPGCLDTHTTATQACK